MHFKESYSEKRFVAFVTGEKDLKNHIMNNHCSHSFINGRILADFKGIFSEIKDEDFFRIYIFG